MLSTPSPPRHHSPVVTVLPIPPSFISTVPAEATRPYVTPSSSDDKIALPSLLPHIDFSPATTATAVTMAHVPRKIYEAKLRDSIASIMASLQQELPQDHIFQQLMADPATLQYSRVRLAEVVEGFLYSKQAEQYHQLVTELARREELCVVQAQQIQELQRALEASTAAAEQQQPLTASPKLPPPPAVTHPNPMEEEEARRELLRILEQSTVDSEYYRSSDALQAVSSVVDVAQEEPQYDDKYVYEGKLQAELYRCIHTLLRYVDGALESQERLRRDLSEQQRHYNTGTSGLMSDILTPGPSTLLSKDESVVQGEEAAEKKINGSYHSGCLQQKRQHLHRLTERLRDSQLLSSRVLDRLAQQEVGQQRVVDQLRRAVDVARAEATTSAAAVVQARAIATTQEQRRKEEQQATSAEQEDMQEQLSMLRLEVQDAQRDTRAATMRAIAAEGREAELKNDLDSTKASLEQLTAELQEYREAGRSQQVEVLACRARHRDLQNALESAAREMPCLRAECAVATLEALYQDSKAVKAELMEQVGYRHHLHGLMLFSATQQEAVRRLEAQLQAAETAQLERELVQRRGVETLATLLRCMWADDAVEAALIDTAGTDDGKDGSVGRKETAALVNGEEPNYGRSSGRGSAGGSPRSSSGATVMPAYHVPATLSAMCNALEDAYNTVRSRHATRQTTVDQLRAALVGREIEARAAQASDVQLRDLLKAEQAKNSHWQAEMDRWSTHNPMRDLLARQDALLRDVCEERDALRKQWSSLNDDYIALEQRNGVLHARCAEKEQENGRLAGLLQSMPKNRNDARAKTTVVLSSSTPPHSQRYAPTLLLQSSSSSATAATPLSGTPTR